MTDAKSFAFGKFIPGFDFLQNLAASGKGAAGPVSALHHWVAPTVSVDELDKRIAELKAVQFWLEQNTTALKATVQALEVQKMTLATLQGMNLSMAEVAKAFTLPTQESAVSPAAAPPAERASGQWPYSATPAAPAAPATPEAPVAAPEPAPAQDAAEAATPPEPAPASLAAEPPAVPPAAGLADPMAWWGALTQQFQHIASSAMREAVHAMPDAVNAPAAPKPAARKAAKKAPARPAAAGKSAAAKSTRRKARQPAAQPAAKPTAKSSAKSSAKSAAQSAARPARKPAAKSAPQRASAKAKAEAPRAGSGWPLPPPFKLGR